MGFFFPGSCMTFLWVVPLTLKWQPFSSFVRNMALECYSKKENPDSFINPGLMMKMVISFTRLFQRQPLSAGWGADNGFKLQLALTANVKLLVTLLGGTSPWVCSSPPKEREREEEKKTEQQINIYYECPGHVHTGWYSRSWLPWKFNSVHFNSTLFI